MDLLPRSLRFQGEGKKLRELARLSARGYFKPRAYNDDDDDSAHDNSTVDEALAAFGLVRAAADDVDDEAADAGAAAAPVEVFYLLPEHQLALEVWNDIDTQWRVGLIGRTGLDYAAVQAHLQLAGIPRKRHAELHAQLRIMEHAALREWHRIRERQASTRGR
ncbi:MAG: hypothetical protein C0423_03230 [Methylibium sp.]|nr:hypothetical protein [Methylibium sp.]